MQQNQHELRVYVDDGLFDAVATAKDTTGLCMSWIVRRSLIEWLEVNDFDLSEVKQEPKVKLLNGTYVTMHQAKRMGIKFS